MPATLAPTAKIKTVPFLLPKKFGTGPVGFLGDKVKISDEAQEFYPDLTGKTFTLVKDGYGRTWFHLADEDGNLFKAHFRIFKNA